MAVIAIAGAVYVLALRPGDGPPVETPAATQSTTPAATAAASPSASPITQAPTIELATFTSPMHGFTFAYPAAWVPRPATTQWTDGYVEPEESFVDSVRPEGSPLGAQAGIAAQPLPEGKTPEAWLQDWVSFRDAAGVACRFAPEAWTHTVVGGADGLRIEASCSIANHAPFDGVILEAAWVIDGTGYVATGTPTVVEIMLASFEAG